jgi:murein DD-endopeptidase MepM/ murein hydrolase activator NlpD
MNISRYHLSFLLVAILFSSLMVSFGTGFISPAANLENNSAAISTGIASGLQSSTGFYWPTDKGDPKIYNNWLSASCSWSAPKTYQTDYYHIGMDVIGAEKDRIYAIADGTVIRISRNNLSDPTTKALVDKGQDPAGWGIGNIAILIDHQLVDGSHFVAVYGHIKDDPKNKIHTGVTKTVHAHDLLGLMGPYPTKPHLHLGIYPIKPGGPKSPSTPLGRMVCPKAAPITDTNGFTSPYAWLTTKTPLSSVCGLVEYHSQTGAWDGTLTVSGTNKVIQLWTLPMPPSAWGISGYKLPAYYRFYGPKLETSQVYILSTKTYETRTNMISFYNVEMVSSCP